LVPGDLEESMGYNHAQVQDFKLTFHVVESAFSVNGFWGNGLMITSNFVAVVQLKGLHL